MGAFESNKKKTKSAKGGTVNRFHRSVTTLVRNCLTNT